MREIEYRAWIKSENRMITDKQDFIPLIVTNKGVMKLQPQFKENYYEFLPNDKIELMQWTGLYDKNKIKIYEGDLISAIWGDEIHIIGEVKQRIDGLWIIESINHNNQEFCVFHPNKDGDTNVKVIGNIYENEN